MQNPKLDLKSILSIVLIILLVIISFVLVVGYIISSVDPNHSITGYSIAISFVGVFATFGGAYLGAKISGNNALKIANRDIETSEFKIALFLSKAENKYLSLKDQIELEKGNEEFVDLQKFLDKYKNATDNYYKLLQRDIERIIRYINIVIEDDNFYYIAKELNSEEDLLNLFDIKNALLHFKGLIERHYRDQIINSFDSFLTSQDINTHYDMLLRLKETLDYDYA
ncbi:TPA: hypothetical protein OZE57_001713 [Staphylococcus aureus]|uniref:hypothetical protein n=1 Tax=Staphylococcus TaxID=1279 RepID=UPI0005058AEE|nr:MULTISPECIES: hypothetical protein [Staphylococcus]CDR66705.1 hypothetical protein ERS140167_01581 [Staphylococcus schweitzeri]SGS29185.1 Uncharacterised protein [Staphylococcus aureus]SGS46169.1 Uncharacterised protein [Staphylococcus aureus]SGU96150.1 Uncharacterised protein [Staphylococcus aureus]HCX2152593.1 hypothetical protein [Staphylococcus aureus]